jgi:hypothetical protein
MVNPQLFINYLLITSSKNRDKIWNGSKSIGISVCWRVITPVASKRCPKTVAETRTEQNKTMQEIIKIQSQLIASLIGLYKKILLNQASILVSITSAYKLLAYASVEISFSTI